MLTNNEKMATLSIDSGVYSANAKIVSRNGAICIKDASKINIQLASGTNILIDNQGVATLNLIGKELRGYLKESVLILVNNTKFTPAENNISLEELTITRASAEKSSVFFSPSGPQHSEEQRQLLRDARDGNWREVRAAGEKSINGNIRSREGFTPLYIAVQNGHIRVVRELLNMNVDVNQPDHDGTTPAWIAASLNHVDILTLLAKNKADLHTKWRKESPLAVAIRKGHLSIIRVLSYYIDINADDGDYSPLHAATEFDSICGLIISNTIPENLNYEHYILTDSVLVHYLPYQRRECIAKEASQLKLLKATFKENIKILSRADRESIASITGIANTRKNKRVQTLLECQANPKINNHAGEPPILTAIALDNPKLVELYARYAASLNFIVHGFSPLHHVAVSGKSDIFQILLNYGAEPFLSIDYGITPLFIAAQYNNKDIVNLYLKRNLFVSLLSEAKFPVEYLRTFAKKRGEEIVQRMEVLIDKKIKMGVDLIPVNPCDIARVMGHQEIVALFEAPSSVREDNFMYVKFG